MHHVRGSSSLVHEPDVALVLNDKAAVVSASRLSLDSTRSGVVRNRLVVSVEKHRNGLSDFDIEFAKDYSHYRIHPDGVVLPESPIDDVLLVD
jgi:hypothetical protein